MAQLFSHLSKTYHWLFRLCHFHAPSKYIAPLTAFLLLLAFKANLFAAQANPTYRVMTPVITPAITALLPFNFTLDFEDGDLRGWTAKGEAFATQPTLDDNPTARNRGQPSNHQGRYWIGTYENFQGRQGQRPGSIQGDGPQGILRSGQFIIAKGNLSFLVGGGSEFETRVELLVQVNNDPEFGWQRVLWAAGQNNETMRWVTWDLTPYAGKPGIIQIVDLSSGGWGHINADNFSFSTPAAGTAPPQEIISVKIPPLVGRHRDQAVEMITSGRLTLGGITEQIGPQTPNTVIAQNPQADAVVPVGTPVYLVTAAPDMVPVPSVIRYDEDQARNILTKYRLQLGSVVPRPSDAPPGTVIDQEPPARSMVLAGSRVDIVVAAVKDIEVPRVIDFSRNDAFKILNEAGLTIGKIAERRSPKNPDTVLDQRPEPKTKVAPGTAVSLLIAIPDLVPVPDLLRHTEAQAKSLLADARLQLGRVAQRESDERPGAIIAQEPEATTMVQAGSRVDIAVAAARLIKVPRVIDLSQDDAVTRLQDRGLAIGAITRQPSDAIPNTVLDQTPAPETFAKEGSPVSLLVAAPKVVFVPDLAGMTREAAIDLLYAKKLKLGTLEDRPHDAPKNTIIGQEPLPGSQVPEETPVNLVLAAEKLVPVPDVGGMLRDAALAKIIAAELVVGAINERSSDQQAGTVLEQWPAANQPVEKNTSVSLVIAAREKAVIPWGLYGAVAGATLLAVGAAACMFARRPKKVKKTEPPKARPDITVEPHYDPGQQTVRPVGLNLVNYELCLEPHLDPGTQNIEYPNELIINKG